MKFIKKLKEFTKECIRVLKVTRKPDMKEFKTIIKITGLGLIVIGMIGFIIQMTKMLIFG